jgi:hypothetical protein
VSLSVARKTELSNGRCFKVVPGVLANYVSSSRIEYTP